jgi:hypothetical protein
MDSSGVILSSKRTLYWWRHQKVVASGTLVCLFIYLFSFWTDYVIMRPAHSVAYFTQDSLDSLRTINDLPQLASLNIPPGKYRTARTGRPNRAHHQGLTPPSATGYLPSKTLGPLFRHPSSGTEGYTIHDDVGSNRTDHHHVICHGNRSKSFNADNLAPLTYLQSIPPSRRHPLDEEALMSFSTEILGRIL